MAERPSAPWAKSDAACKVKGGKLPPVRQEEATNASTEVGVAGLKSKEGLAFKVGDQVEVRWTEPSEDGKFYYYAATVLSIIPASCECLVKWKDPMGFDPEMRVLSKFVKPKRKRKRINRIQSAGPVRDDWRRQIEEQRLFLPHQSSSGRTVKHVNLFTFKEHATPVKQPPLRPGSWVGKCLREQNERMYYDCVELTSSGERIHAGQCISLRPPARWRTGWDSSRLWVAAVKEMYEDEASNMVLGCVWFYRPRDCIHAQLPPGTRLQDEVFLSEEEDDNTLYSVVGVCKVLGESDFFRALERAGSVVDGAAESKEDPSECTILCRYRYDDESKRFAFIKDTDSAVRLACAKLALKELILHHIKRFQVDWMAAVGRQKRRYTQKTWEGPSCARDSEDAVSCTSSKSTKQRSSCSSADSAPPQLSPGSTSPAHTDYGFDGGESDSLPTGLEEESAPDRLRGASSDLVASADEHGGARELENRKRKQQDSGGYSDEEDAEQESVEGGDGVLTPVGEEDDACFKHGDSVRCRGADGCFRDAKVREVLDGELCVVTWAPSAASTAWSPINAMVRIDAVFPRRDAEEEEEEENQEEDAPTAAPSPASLPLPAAPMEYAPGGWLPAAAATRKRCRSRASTRLVKGLPGTRRGEVGDASHSVRGSGSDITAASVLTCGQAGAGMVDGPTLMDQGNPDGESDEVGASARKRPACRRDGLASERSAPPSGEEEEHEATIASQVDAFAMCCIADELISLPRNLQLLPTQPHNEGCLRSLYAQELDSSYHSSQTVTSTGIVSERRERRWHFGPYVLPFRSTAGLCKLQKRAHTGAEQLHRAGPTFQTLAEYLKQNRGPSLCEGRRVGVKSNNTDGQQARKLEGFLTLGGAVEDGEPNLQVQTATHGVLCLTLFCAHNLVLPEDPMEEIVLLDSCVGEGAREEAREGAAPQRDKGKSLAHKDLRKTGLEWYPKLSTSERRSRPGYGKLYVCSAPMCGQAFADIHFCKAHQMAAKHGWWDGDTPVSKGGRTWMQVVDCTSSGRIQFQNSSVEKKMRKFVVQRTTSEEPRISDDLPLPCKVMHTGDKGKGWGLFASRRISKGEFIGHYAGTVVDVGYTKRYTGHYTFGLIHGLAIDGTGGGALRFMNHAMQDQKPSVHALIVNHYGVCHVAVYALRDIDSGEEMTLRYTDASDAEFFATACGLD